MAIEQDWQGNVRALTFGAGTDWQIDEPGITGLGIPAPRTRDTEAGDRHGDVGGDDVLPRRILYVPLWTSRSSAGAAWTAFEEELKVAWAESITDEPLDLRLPGMPSTGRRFFGRPRGAVEDLSRLKSGTIRALCTFDALDPMGYGDEVASGEESGTFEITNTGTAPTDRITLTITGNGGTPRIVNNSVDGDDVTFAVAVSGTRTVDVRGRNVVDGSSNDARGELSAGTLWFDLQKGVNSLTLTGAASVVVAHRPAFR